MKMMLLSGSCSYNGEREGNQEAIEEWQRSGLVECFEDRRTAGTVKIAAI